MKPVCCHCFKPLRKCKRVDIVDREIHFACIEKIQNERYKQLLEELRSMLRRKNIILL